MVKSEHDTAHSHCTPVHVIIVAGGSGSRFGGGLPKQYHMLGQRPVLMHTIEAMRRACPHADITLVIDAAMSDFWIELCRTHSFESPKIVSGGSTRWQSVANALATIENSDGITLVHDGARPLVDESVVLHMIEILNGTSAIDGVVPTIAITDSLRMLHPGGSSHAVDRSLFRAVQTPQAFITKRLKLAYDKDYQPTFTDDASVMEASGYSIALCDGSTDTIKITYPDDLALAEMILARRANKN